jgi:Asp-tRNA(Asn)/Glu-tRNA(Gln) amidotransferase C subunit
MINPDKYIQFSQSNSMSLLFYGCIVVITQWVLNTYTITNTCGGDIIQNAGTGAYYTFIPWIFIFGMLLSVINYYPAFKSAFSDVVGYFYVSYSANKVISELLIDKDVQDQLDKGNFTHEQTEAMQDAAEAIIKICGNVSILINQIVPQNFQHYWEILKPLRKDKFQDEQSQETINIKNELFNLVVEREDVGEFLWYVYTGLLLTSIVQLKISTNTCNSSVYTLSQNQQAYQQSVSDTAASQSAAQNTVYTIT